MDISYVITASVNDALLVAQSATLSNRTAEQVAASQAEGAKMVSYARALVRPEGDCTVTLQFGTAAQVSVASIKRNDIKTLLSHVADEWVGNGIKG